MRYWVFAHDFPVGTHVPLAGWVEGVPSLHVQLFREITALSTISSLYCHISTLFHLICDGTFVVFRYADFVVCISDHNGHSYFAGSPRYFYISRDLNSII